MSYHGKQIGIGTLPIDRINTAGYTPSAASDLANVEFVQALFSGLDPKEECRFAAVGNVNIATPPSSFDGITASNGNRLLLHEQTDPTENGVWIYNVGGLVRATDFDGTPSSEVKLGAFVFIQEGTVWGGYGFFVSGTPTTPPNITVGTDPIIFSALSRRNPYIADSGITITGNQIRLGGPLAVDTDIDGNDLYNVSMTSLTNFEVGTTADRMVVSKGGSRFRVENNAGTQKYLDIVGNWRVNIGMDTGSGAGAVNADYSVNLQANGIINAAHIVNAAVDSTFAAGSEYSFASGRGHIINGEGSHVSGIGARVNLVSNQRGGFAHGFNVGSGALPGGVPLIIAAAGAANISRNTAAQTNGNGALAQDSVILGGYNHHIPSTSPGSVILGGNSISARASDPNQVYLMNLNIMEAPDAGVGADNVLVLDAATGQVKSVTQASLGGPASTASNGLTKVVNDIQLGGALTADTTISGAFDLIIDGLDAFRVVDTTVIQLGSPSDPADVIEMRADSGIDIIANSGGIVTISSGSVGMQFDVSANGFIIYDSRTLGIRSGVEYAADYSANYVARSLVDKAYVDGLVATAGNGLSKSGNQIRLGGILSQDTTIETTTNNGLTILSVIGTAGLSIDAGGQETIIFSSGGSQFIGDTSPADTGITFNEDTVIRPGLRYNPATKNHADWTDDTMVDKEYVDDLFATGGVTASNGLTKVVNDIQLGGTLTGATDVDVTPGLTFTGTGTADIIFVDGTFAAWNGLIHNGTDYSPWMGHMSDEFYIDGTGGHYNSVLGGIHYGADYSADYDDRSLVDRGYVTAAIAAYTPTLSNGSGTTAAGAAVNLGGVLTANTSITTGTAYTNTLSFGAAATPLSSFTAHGQVITTRGSASTSFYSQSVTSYDGSSNVSTVITSRDSTNGLAQAVVSRGNGGSSNILLEARHGATTQYSSFQLSGSTTLSTSQWRVQNAGTNYASITMNSGTGFTTGSIVVGAGSASFTGMQYLADYSANYTSRSLVDKGYVDGAITGAAYTAANGLSISGSDIILGGTLGSATVIDVVSNSLQIASATDVGYGISDVTVGFGASYMGYINASRMSMTDAIGDLVSLEFGVEIGSPDTLHARFFDGRTEKRGLEYEPGTMVYTDWTDNTMTSRDYVNNEAATLTNKTLGTGTAFADGVRMTFNPNGTNAGLNAGSHSAEPSSPVNGDIFYNSTSNQLRSYINGTWVNIGGAGGTYTASNGLSMVGNDVQMGGDLTGSVLIDGLSTHDITYLGVTYFAIAQGTNISLGTAGNQAGNVEIRANGAIDITAEAGNMLSIGVVGGNGVYFQMGNGTGEFVITDERISGPGATGVEYAADYSATFTARSLVDKGYVDSVAGGVTSGSGITVSGGAVNLGGALDQSADIYSSGFNLNLYGSAGGSIASTDGLDYWDTISFQSATSAYFGTTTIFFDANGALDGNLLISNNGTGNISMESVGGNITLNAPTGIVSILGGALNMDGGNSYSATFGTSGGNELVGFNIDTTGYSQWGAGEEGIISILSYNSVDGGGAITVLPYGLQFTGGLAGAAAINMSNLGVQLSASASEIQLAGSDAPIILNGVSTASETLTFTLTPTATTPTLIVDTTLTSTFAGIQYGQDYSANFTDDSLINKGFADDTYLTTAAASGFWKTSSTTTISANSLIDLNTFNLSFSGGRVTFGASPTRPAFNIGSNSSNPSSPSNGDTYYNDSAHQVRVYVNGSWVSLSGGSSSTASNGLTETAGDIQLGGALTEDTVIDGGSSYDLTFSNIDSFQLIAQNGLQLINPTAGDYTMYNGGGAFALTTGGTATSFEIAHYGDNDMNISHGGTAGDMIISNQTGSLLIYQNASGLDLLIQANGSSNLTMEATGGDVYLTAAGGNMYISSSTTDPISFGINGNGDLVQLDQYGFKYDADYSASWTSRHLVDKAYVDSISASLAPPDATDKNVASANTSGNGSTTAVTISNDPKGFILVVVNGEIVSLGNAVKTLKCYFSADGGTTARAHNAIQSGDTLYWNGVVAGYDLATTDTIDLFYIP